MSKPSKPGIDLDQRRRHAEGLRLWEHAHGRKTGPKTPEGRFRAAQRSRQHGVRGHDGQALMKWLATVNRLVREIRGGRAEAALSCPSAPSLVKHG